MSQLLNMVQAIDATRFRTLRRQREDQMKTDLYTKATLTIIAVCLVWLSLGGPALITTAQAQTNPQAQAQSQPTDVVIAGWKDPTGLSTSSNGNRYRSASVSDHAVTIGDLRSPGHLRCA